LRQLMSNPSDTPQSEASARPIEKSVLTMPPVVPETISRDQAAKSFEIMAGPPPDVPGYEILAELGRGGMGVVYKARDLGLNRIVALKMIVGGGHASHEDLTRFVAEAEAVAAMQHPNIVQIFETGRHNGLPFFTLEYVDGGTLGAWVRDHPLHAEHAAHIVEQLARGVAYAHGKGIVHRDLKPDNVLLSAVSGTPAALLQGTTADYNRGDASANGRISPTLPIPKITDFGLAKRVQGGSGVTHSGAIMGTPSYMSPEQAEGKKDIGPGVDVYALGAILYR